MGDVNNVAPDGAQNWLGDDGMMRVQGEDINLREMDVGEIDELHARLALDMSEKQVMAIQAEYARRKTLMPPLSEFAWQAVESVYGEDGYKAVIEVARGLQGEYVAIMNRTRPRALLVTRQSGYREYACGDKIRHDDVDSAIKHIDRMEAAGLDVRDLKVYLCPWCYKFHVGNDPNRKARRRKRARDKEQKAAARAAQEGVTE